MPDPEVRINVKTVESSNNSGLGKVRDQLRDLAQAIPGVSATMGAMGTAIGAVGVAFATAGKAIQEFAQSETAFARLDASLARAGLLTDAFRSQLSALAGELQRTTGIADDEWLSVLSRLIQFGSRPESIGMDVEAVKNLAGIVGDVSTAVNLYSRVISGNTAVLARYGITVDDLGSQSEKLLRIQEELAKRGAGQLEAATTTLTGRTTSLRNEVGDLLETLGGWITDTFRLREGTDLLAKALAWLNDVVGRVPDRLRNLANAATATRDAEENAAAAAQKHAKALQELREAGEAANKVLDEQIAKITKIQRLEDEKADAQMAVDLAQVDLAEADGKISPQKAVVERAKIRDRARREQIEREQQADAERIKAAQAAYYQSREEEAKLQFEKDKLDDPALIARRKRLADDAAALTGSRRSWLRASGETVLGAWLDRVTGGGAQELSDAADMLAIRANGANEGLQVRRDQYGQLIQERRGITSSLRQKAIQTQADLIPQMMTREQVGANERRADLMRAEAEVARMDSRGSPAMGRDPGTVIAGALRANADALREAVAVAAANTHETLKARQELQSLRAQVKDHSNR